MRQPVLFAAAWMGGTLLSFVAMAIAGRELSFGSQYLPDPGSLNRH